MQPFLSQNLKILIIGILLFPAMRGLCQERATPHFPQNFNQFSQAYSMTNPAFIGSETDLGIDLGNKIFGNNFGKRYTLFGTFHFQMNDEANNNDNDIENDHYLGVNLYREQEGEFIGRTRGYLLYSVNVPLSDSLTISGGLGAGALNYVVEPDPSGFVAGNSVMVFDLKGGVWLSSPSYYLGFSVNQAFNNTFRPIVQPIELSRFYQVMGGVDFSVSDHVDLKPQFNYSYRSNDSNFFRIGVMANISGKLEGGLNYQHQNPRTISPVLGLTNVSVGNNLLEAKLSYRRPIGEETYSGLDIYELTIGYYFD